MSEPAAQPLLASASRAVQRLAELGDPLPADVAAQVSKLVPGSSPDVELRRELESLLRPFVLVEAEIDRSGMIVCTPGAAPPRLVQHGWRSFLMRVANPHRIETTLYPQAQGVFGIIDQRSHAARTALPDALTSVPRIAGSWLEVKLASPGDLSGLEAEYTVISLYSRDGGTRSGAVMFAVAAPDEPESLTRPPERLAMRRTMFEGRSYAASFEFDCRPSQEIRFDVREPDGSSCVATITVCDAQGRIYPSKAMRLAPDMFFHDHVYRATGEVIRLPEGHYQISARRGPEYRETRRDVEITSGTEAVAIALDRWVDPARRGYYSGDPHIHAGGCSHYNVPTEGVTPETMIRHVRGEGLWLGSVLTWGPCYYHQKQFFSGESISPPALLEHAQMQQAQGMTWTPRPTDRDHESMLRYDVEVSGFPSSHSGHAILLGLTDQDYPNITLLEDWPSWNLPIMRWARAQGALVGYAHCGLGLSVGTDELPNHLVPSFASIGSNEIIVDVPLGAADFQCGAEVAPAAELNIWYHLLNVGYRTLMLGETDYPCIYDEGPGVGRTYVRLPEAPHGPHALETWMAGLQNNASYFGDGRSHVFDLAVDGDVVREHAMDATGTVRVTATVAAWLPEQPPPPPEPGRSAYSAPVGWHLERARIGDTRDVLLEVLVNGVPVASREVAADGAEHAVAFDVPLERSSWIAMRILPSVHTQPVFVEIAGQPIRASRRSAQWLHDSVEALWESKSGFIRDGERAAAREAYDAARAAYRARHDECEVD
ncbi:CehA/McbA family metallohydrolase [Phytoactinopolyspora halotolerans]|uniref:CehA/McbA family metallohydrolase n=1 Tax=Phytoactinopolyspora halotolerans TaxID=1981512 RepID=A0A6L9S8D4_9ACTN|nr:CehA/McbA family metallohydrolase [Phytoactinopolyspora halotolerans]NEE00788.1 CehA/McbA family metallohydrolase [Phytoactinopolyspora halotolerans]